MRGAFVLRLLLAGAVVAHAPVVEAQQPPPDETAAAASERDLFVRGVELRKQGRDAEALAVFEQAYARAPSPHAVAQIALAEQALGRWIEAERGLLGALRDTEDPWIALQRAYLEQGLATVQAHLGWLDIESNVAGAEVRIDEAIRVRLPLQEPMRVVAGDVTVDVLAPGYAPVLRKLHVDPNAHVHVAFTLFAQPVPTAAATGAEPVQALARSGVALGDGGTTARAIGRVALVSAGVLAVAGIGALLTRELEAQAYNGGGCAPTTTESRYDRCPADRNIGSAVQTAAVVAFAGSGAAAVAGGVLLLMDGHRRPDQSGSAIACRWMGTAIGCGGTF